MELLKRDFSDVPTERLFDLLVKCFAILKTETENAFCAFSDEKEKRARTDSNGRPSA
jgi:hypothetical protein